MAAPTSFTSFNYDSYYSDATSTQTTTVPTDYPVFPNNQYIGRWYVLYSDVANLTHLDIDLFNECYLPSSPYTYDDRRKREIESSSPTPRPSYLINEAPCARQRAINVNCYLQNTNGTFAGLEPYTDNFPAQQKCYCETYPFFDSATGCNACFMAHGGIEGYHWFPTSYIDAVSSSYCNANPQTAEFYSWVAQWSATNEAAKVPTITASDVLGTQTAASLYYTYTAAAAAAAATNSNGGTQVKLSGWKWPLLASLALSSIFAWT